MTGKTLKQNGCPNCGTRKFHSDTVSGRARTTCLRCGYATLADPPPGGMEGDYHARLDELEREELSDLVRFLLWEAAQDPDA